MRVGRREVKRPTRLRRFRSDSELRSVCLPSSKFETFDFLQRNLLRAESSPFVIQASTGQPRARWRLVQNPVPSYIAFSIGGSLSLVAYWADIRILVAPPKTSASSSSNTLPYDVKPQAGHLCHTDHLSINPFSIIPRLPPELLSAHGIDLEQARCLFPVSGTLGARG